MKVRTFAVACALAVVAAACGSKSPLVPSGGGGNPGNGGGPIDVINTPPVVKSVVASDTRIEAGSPVTLTATVEDAETPVDKLQFAWTLPPGTMVAAGNGSSITWTPSASITTPADLGILVTVTETYTSGTTQKQNTATGELKVHVNNSPKELADQALRFLGDFADSRVSAEKCVSEFSTSTKTCANGKSDEFDDIDGNRYDLLILSSTLRHTSLSIAPSKVSATVHTFCSFTSRVIAQQPKKCIGCAYGSVGTTTGDCYTTHVYENGKWWLCESHYQSQGLTSAFQRLIERTLFGGRPPEIP
jgi:hypothetical protein